MNSIIIFITIVSLIANQKCESIMFLNHREDILSNYNKEKLLQKIAKHRVIHNQNRNSTIISSNFTLNNNSTYKSFLKAHNAKLEKSILLQIKRITGIKTSADVNVWKNSFDNSIPILSIKDLIFNTKKGNSAILIWDLFLKDGSIFVIFAPYLKISIDDIVFTIISTNEEDIGVSKTIIFNKKMNECPNQVIIAIITTKRLLSYVQNNEYIEFQISYSKVSKIFNLTKEIEYNVKQQSLVVTGMVNIDNPIEEVITWMEYYKLMNVTHFYLYFLYPIEQASNKSIFLLNDFAKNNNYIFTLIQWHSYFVDGPFNIKNTLACSELAMIQSALYRLKGF